MGIFELLFLILLTLKLLGIGVMATASWWWVFSPLLVAAALWILVLSLVGKNVREGRRQWKAASARRLGGRF